MKHGSRQKLVVTLLVALCAACGKMEPDGDRGGLGSLGGGTNDNTNTTVQSSSGLSCSATPSATSVAYSQVITVTVRVNGAQGGISIDGTSFQNVSNQTSFTFNSSFSGSGATTVTMRVNVHDTVSVATCSYRVSLH